MHGPVFIVGPTSVGKSEIALDVARRTGGEIVNADAFQVYDALSLLTAKPGLEARQEIPHHSFGTVPVAESYNVARYLADATKYVEEIRQRDRLAIVVGGTGLYVKALTHGLSAMPAPDPALRARLEAMDIETLRDELARVDPVAMTQVDLRNKRRIVRALEVSLTTGTPFSSHRDAWTHSAYGPGEAGVFLDREREELCARINRQVDGMFDRGVVEEVRALDPRFIGPTAATTIGLAEIQQMLAGEMTLAACKERIKLRTRQYAKRQVTWFKKESVFRRRILVGTTGLSEAAETLMATARASAVVQGKIFGAC